MVQTPGSIVKLRFNPGPTTNQLCLPTFLWVIITLDHDGIYITLL